MKEENQSNSVVNSDMDIEGKLLELRRGLVAQLHAGIQDVVQAADEERPGSDDLERASEALREEELDIQVAQIGSRADQIAAVNAALSALRNGTYGKCMDCGMEIDARRLSVNPAAQRCVGCAALHEEAVHR